MTAELSWRPPIEWTPYLDAKLTEARVGRRLGWKRVGRVMGMNERTCERRGRKIGIAAPLRKLGRLTPAVKAEILRMRHSGETYRAIGAALGIHYTCAFHCVQTHMSSAAIPAATEVRHGPNTRAAGSPSAVSATLNVPPETGPVASRQRGVLLQGGASK